MAKHELNCAGYVQETGRPVPLSGLSVQQQRGRMTELKLAYLNALFRDQARFSPAPETERSCHSD